MSRGIAARVSGDKFYKHGKEFVVEHLFISPISLIDDKKKEFEAYNPVEFYMKRGEPQWFICICLKSIDEQVCYIKHINNAIDGTAFGKWQTKDFYKQTGLEFNCINSKKELLPYKPSNLIGDSVGSILDIKDSVCERLISLEIKGEVQENFAFKVYDAFNDLENGKLPIFRDCLSQHKAIRDYIGEVIAPLALVNNVAITGITIDDIAQMHNKCIKSIPMVSYQTSANASLIDSTLIWNDSFEVGLSSKGGDGAAASIFSLFSVFKRLKAEDPRKYENLTNKYKKEIEFLECLFSYGIKAGPLVAAYHLNLIEYEDLYYMLDILRHPQVFSTIEAIKDESQLKVEREFDSTLFGDTILAKDCEIYKGFFSKKLFSILINKKVKEPAKSKFEYFALAAIAKAVAMKINEDKNIKINNFFEEILKATCFVQIHAKTKAVGNDIYFLGFETIYPPLFDGKVIIEADKSFYSTKQPQGGFGFKFLASP